MFRYYTENSTGAIELWYRKTPLVGCSLVIDRSFYVTRDTGIPVEKFDEAFPVKLGQICKTLLFSAFALPELPNRPALLRTGDVVVAGRVEGSPVCGLLLDLGWGNPPISLRSTRQIHIAGSLFVVDLGVVKL